MKHSKRFKILWTLWMAGGGIAVATVVYMVTSSVPWTIVGLLASGVVLNLIGQLVTQPIQAVRDVDGTAPAERSSATGHRPSSTH